MVGGQLRSARLQAPAARIVNQLPRLQILAIIGTPSRAEASWVAKRAARRAVFRGLCFIALSQLIRHFLMQRDWTARPQTAQRHLCDDTISR